MPWIIAGLVASVATFVVNNLTSQPTINIAEGSVKDEKETTFFKWGFYGLAGVVALIGLRKILHE